MIGNVRKGMSPRQLKKLSIRADKLIQRGSNIGFNVSRYATRFVVGEDGSELEPDLLRPGSTALPGTIGYGDNVGFEEPEWDDGDAYSNLLEFVSYDCCSWVLPENTGDPDIDIWLTEQPVWPKNIKLTPKFVFRYAEEAIKKAEDYYSSILQKMFLAGWDACLKHGHQYDKRYLDEALKDVKFKNVRGNFHWKPSDLTSSFENGFCVAQNMTGCREEAEEAAAELAGQRITYGPY